MSLEMLQVAEVVAREKNIDGALVLEAMEQAIQMGARRKYGMAFNIQAILDRVDGSVNLKRLWQVVETVMEPVDPEAYGHFLREGEEIEMRPALDEKGKPSARNEREITLAAARKINPKIDLGEYIMEDLPPMDFGRIAAQAAKQVIVQKVRDAEREKEFEEYKSRVGEVIAGIVKRADHRGVLVDLGRAEAFMPKEEMIPRETYRQGDRVRGYIFDVRRELRGPQVMVSRTHPRYLMKLFAEQVPEVANGMIEILNAARDPGFRAKIAVKSADRNIDPVGACVGIRGVRVQAVVEELQGERIDIIEWSADPATYLIKAMAPAEVTKVVVDEEEHRMDVVVPEDKLSLAIGRRGQNVKLASMLTGWDIDVMTETEENQKREEEFSAISDAFKTGLDVDDTMARLLIAEGFTSVDELLLVPVEEIGAVEGLDIDIAEELRNRATAHVEKQQSKLKTMKISTELSSFEGLTSDILVALAENKVKTLDDLADLATDELLDILPKGMLNAHQAEDIIMRARQHWFADEATA